MIPGQPHRFRALLLVTDAYGGVGGIAKFNRDFIAALAAMPECTEVVVVPRIAPELHDPVPRGVKFLAVAAGGKLRFIYHALREAWHGRFDLVINGHINLSMLGVFLAWIKRARSVLILHGIDAWKTHSNLLVRLFLPHMDYIIGVSNVTLKRFGKWAHVDPARFRLLPNCVDLAKFTTGPKPADLTGQLGLTARP
jgi:phosphatidylinositol alpha-1,6-mannosyltransferase